MAGTIPLSMTQQMDEFGAPLAGGLLYFIQAGTVSTPQNAYQDSGLTLPLANPVTLDASGRVPQLFLADATEAPMTGLIKIRLTSSAGVTQLVADNIMVIGPSGGGGGGGGVVDATTVAQTGDMKIRYGTGVHTGWVRCNNLTIGSATSGATERANADTQALFEHLYQVDSTLAVSGGRGASAAADWAANKTIVMPDWRGYGLGFLDDMGNTAAGRLTLSYFGTSAIVLGATGGAESKTLVIGNLPPYTPSGSVSSSGALTSFSALSTAAPASAGTSMVVSNAAGGTTALSSVSGSVSVTSTLTGTAQGGSSTPFSVIGPRKLCSLYIKL